MTRQEINKAFAEKVKQLCPKAKDVSMCGYSLVVTFRGEQSAIDAAVLLSSVVSKVRVYESRDDLVGVIPHVANRSSYKVWRVSGLV